MGGRTSFHCLIYSVPNKVGWLLQRGDRILFVFTFCYILQSHLSTSWHGVSLYLHRGLLLVGYFYRENGGLTSFFLENCDQHSFSSMETFLKVKKYKTEMLQCIFWLMTYLHGKYPSQIKCQTHCNYFCTKRSWDMAQQWHCLPCTYSLSRYYTFLCLFNCFL